MTLQIGGLMCPRDGPLSMLGCDDLNARIFGDYYGVTEEPAAGSHWFGCQVEIQLGLGGWPSGCGHGQLAGPLQMQLIRQGMRSYRAVASIISPLRPIGGMGLSN